MVENEGSIENRLQLAHEERETLFLTPESKLVERYDTERILKLPFLSRDLCLLRTNIDPGKPKAAIMAIRSNDKTLSVSDLAGVDFSVLAYLDGRELWPNDRKLDCEKRFPKSKLESLVRGNKKAIWGMLEEMSTETEFIKKFGRINLKRLTPYLAVKVIIELIRKKMKYDDLMMDGQYGYNPEKINTGEKELASEWNKDSPKIKKYIRKLNEMRADELLNWGWGCCRHFSALSTFIYNVLKEKQETLFLNGTYLLYYSSTSILKPDDFSGIEDHVINLLVITSPVSLEEKNIPGIFITPVNITKEMGGHNLENVNYELGTAVLYFIRNFGNEIGITDSKSKAEEIGARIIEYYSSLKDKKIRTEKGIDNIAAVLLENPTKNPIATIYNAIKSLGDYKTHLSILERMWKIPVISKIIDQKTGGRILRKPGYLDEYLELLNQYNFDEAFNPESTLFEDLSKIVLGLIKPARNYLETTINSKKFNQRTEKTYQKSLNKMNEVILRFTKASLLAKNRQPVV